MATGNTQQIINYGASANDGTGDPLRTAFIKTDENFSNIWLAGPVGSNITITNNTISSINTNGNISLRPNGTGVIEAQNHLVPKLNKVYNLGSEASMFATVYATEVKANVNGIVSLVTYNNDTDRDTNITVPSIGMLIVNLKDTSTGTLQFYNGAAWVDVA